MIVSVMLIVLFVNLWLIRPILALNVLWQSGQVVPDVKSRLDCCCLSFRFLLFPPNSAHLLASKAVVPSWTKFPFLGIGFPFVWVDVVHTHTMESTLWLTLSATH